MDVRDAILDGLSALHLLRLPNAPAHARMEEVTGVWLAILEAHCRHWTPERDKGRMEAAFMRMCAEAERWPTPKQVIERIPPRKPLPELPIAKRKPRKDPRFAELLKMLTESKDMTKIPPSKLEREP